MGEVASLDEKDVPESLMDVAALIGDAIPDRALIGGLVCASGERVVSAEEKTVDSVFDEVCWLLGGE
jgi:hypothetical protein